MFKHVNGLSTFLLVFFLAVLAYGQDTNQLKKAHLSQAKVTLAKDGKSPTAISFSRGNQPTVATFFQEYRQSFPLAAESQLQATQVTNDKLGAHHRFNQYYKGIELAGAQMVLHEKAGTVWYANGHLVHGMDMDVTPALSESAALQAALSYINAKSYMWEKPEREAFLKREQKNNSATFYPKGELKLTSGRAELTAENMKLVYRFDIYAEKPLGRYYVDVDAKTGKIINKLDRIHDTAFPPSDVPGSGASVYNGTVAMTVDEFSPGSFRLQEHVTRAAAIETYDMLNGTDYGSAVDFTSAAATGPWDASGVSAHWGTEATYDYYFSAHGRNSVDGAGLALLSYVHFDVALVNAFWDGTRMTYGDGDGVDFGPVISLDVVGHELTHAVTDFSSALVYMGESGALNESFSDIFGNLTEFSQEGAPGVGTGNWRIGEDLDLIGGEGFRNMEDPNELGQPDTYEGTFWTDPGDLGDGDNGGVHTNSGVQNFWFVLLSEGGSGTNDNGDAYSVTGIGLVDAAAIAYHNNNSFLTASSNYDDARNGAIACAEALFGVASPQALSTAAAWDAVGVDGLPPPTGKPFVFLADTDVEIDREGTSEGNIHANDDIVFKTGKPSTYKGDLTAVDDITIASKNTIDGDATAGDEVDVASGSTVTGTITEDAAVANEPLPTPSFTAGGSDVTVPQNGTVTLAPGTYDDVTVNKKGTLKLSSGDYFVDQLDLKDPSRLIIDVGSGPVNINVVEKLSFGKKVVVSITPSGEAGSDQVTFTQLDDDKVTIGESARVLGTVIAVEAEVRLSKNSRFKGAVCAEKIVVDQGTVFLPHGSSTSLPKPSEVEESEDSEQSPVTSYQLEQNYPNPFNPTTIIRFALPEAGQVTVKIFNTAGQEVRTLVSGRYEAGHFSMTWDGRNNSGQTVASGVYLYQLRAGTFTQVRKMSLVR